MTGQGLLQIGLFLAVLVALVKPLGEYMARVYEGKPCGTGPPAGLAANGSSIGSPESIRTAR